MARPTNKTELLMLSNSNYLQLKSYFIATESNKNKKTLHRHKVNWNIKDVLAYIHHWHIMFLEWYNTGMKGLKPDMPAKGFTWKRNTSSK